ncbi:TonB-dependent receptor [Catalinimonas sp. 4WD22]|uniref:SusC/RagA family TonB-linked outer membrane protein n=1 Tax=Catalinimonas locisalis TaxID=3133978 RepID=UPI0031015632
MKHKSKKTLLWMSRLMLYSTLFQFFLIDVLHATDSHGQDDKSVYEIQISLRKDTYKLEDVLREIEEKTDFSFTYDDSKVNLTSHVLLGVKAGSLGEILMELSKLESIKFKRIGRNIHISRKIESEDSILEQAVIVQPLLIVSGTVSSPTDNEGLPGVNVLVKGSSTGTVTDIEGRYSINVPNANDTLIFSSIGYTAQEVPVNGRSVIDITLTEDIQSLSEVVVVGYGSMRKQDITNAVSVIDMDKIGERPASNMTSLMQGQAPGVVVKQNTGTPGEELEVNVRGISSLGAGSDPLYVIDGFAVGNSVGQYLNPADIESITVLKDAASTAIYGARGSNGVVLITTKSAKEGQVNLSFNATYGIQNIPDSRRTKMMNGPEFAQMKKEAFMDKIRYFEGREPSVEEVPINYRYPEETQYSTDWVDEILNQNASFQNYNVMLAAGKGAVKSLLSVGYVNQEGAVIETGFERYNVRANLMGDINKNISLGWNLAGSFTDEAYANTTGRDAIMGQALWADPRYPVYNEDGTFNAYIGGVDGVFGTSNPVQELKEMQRDRNKTNVISNGYVEFSFLQDFRFRSSVNVGITNLRENEFRPSFLAGRGFNNPPPREASQREFYSELINVSTDQVLSYSKNLGDHQVSAMLGYSAQEENLRGLGATGDEYPDDIVRFLDAAARVDAGSFEEGWSLLAYIARVNYSFRDKYLMSATYRREGSSRFGANNKWGDFPAVSVGWRISEEPFLQNSILIDDLKLRASWGVTGNNDIGNYTSLSTMNPANYILGNSFASGQVLAAFANADLGWEQSNQLNIGLDLALFENQLSFTAEYYNKVTNDMLLPIEIPAISGFQSTFSNIGKVENKGIEMALGYRTAINELNLRADFNISFNRNKVLEILGENDEIRNGGFYSTYNVSVPGRPIGMFHGFRMLGIFNTEEEIDNAPIQDGAIPGVYIYEDTNGDGVISYDTEDMVEIGNPHPKFVWGLTLGADYKRFDINVLVTGAQDYDLFRNIEATTLNMDGVFNILAEGKNRWRSAENPGNGWIPTTNTWKWQRESNSRYVYDGSHAWIRNVSLGYTIPSFNNTRVFFSADNLLLISQYPGNNPDVNQRGGINPGFDDETYPVPTTYSLGAKINF